MSRISSSVGLITGIPIEETVNKLMAIAARPRELVASRTQTLDAERLAVTKLTSLMLAFEFEVNRLSSASLFNSRTVTSSDSKSLQATAATEGTPAIGSYKFKPLQAASAHQLTSASLQSIDDLASEGQLTFGFGGFVDKGISLDELNAGAGVRKGAIRVTDRAGNVAEVDLRLARTTDDVILAINNNSGANVSAAAVGDRLVLTDDSGGSGNLKVQDTGGGKTALDLGLAGINVAANVASGSDIFSLHAGTKLTAVNDGIGVSLGSGTDLSITLADATTLNIDLGTATTIGQVIAAINGADAAKLSASIAADGNRIELTDLTSGASAFTAAGTAAESLGLTVDADGDTLTGRRLVSGLRDTLVTALRGGAGLGTLGQVDITNRNGVTSSVDLSAAETLGEIIAAINAQAMGVSAAINSARNGIVLVDQSGGTANDLIVADGDANSTATALGIVGNSTSANVNSGSLGRQQIGRATLLSSLNGGLGIVPGDLLITDSNGTVGAVDLNAPGNTAKTIGDVIDRINAINTANVEARINETGDGIIIIDQAAGPGTLQVEDVGASTTARDLRLTRAAVEQEFGGETRQVIDGTSRFSVDLSDLSDPAAGIQLSSLNGGTGVALGSFRITDTDGQSAVVVMSGTSGTFHTVADVIAAINSKSIGVEARINDAGTGILIYDTAGGSGSLKVEELAGGTTAADLGLDASVSTIVVEGDERQAINGAGTFSQSTTQSGLASLAVKINQLDAGVTASAIFDGSGYRLMLAVNKTGSANELLVDGSDAGLSFEQLNAPRDAVLELGGSTAGTGLLVASGDGTFNSLIPGVSLTVVAGSSDIVTIDVAKSQSEITTAVKDFVSAFNSIRNNLDEVTAFDPEALSTGILFGTSAALRVESDLNRVLSGRFIGFGQFTSLESIGLGFDAGGKLVLDESKLEKAATDDPAALEKFFTDSVRGLGGKLKSTIENLAGADKSVLSSRAEVLAGMIEGNTYRLTFMVGRLTRERERLLLQFAQLESTIAAMQQNLTALAGMQIIPPLTSTSANSR